MRLLNLFSALIIAVSAESVSAASNNTSYVCSVCGGSGITTCLLCGGVGMNPAVPHQAPIPRAEFAEDQVSALHAAALGRVA